MQRNQNGVPAEGANGYPFVPQVNWSGEIRPQPSTAQSPQSPQSPQTSRVPQTSQSPQTPQSPQIRQNPSGSTGSTIVNVTDIVQEPSSSPDMLNRLPADVIDSPTTSLEAYRGSLNAMLSQNIGNYIVASFLVGTQGLVTWEGVLYEVGNNYLTIYQASRDRYIVADIYSLKFIEFYDTQRRELCDRILRGDDWQLEPM